ncbi:MAG: sodium/proline symporter [Simkania sp.]|nr:sodium/proline symporter [Simkania sp.]
MNTAKYSWELIAIIIYFVLLTIIGMLSLRKQKSDTDFLIGGRGLNYWLTALAAHASDMSSWLFMGYPAVIYATGLVGSWTAIGLLVFMFLNWQLIAPKVRVATEQYNSLTFSSYFETRFADTSGWIRATTGIMAIAFYTIYISAGLVGFGLLLETLFNLSYNWGILIGIIVVIPYVFVGGYTTLAWIDLFQGLFLLCVIIFVPFFSINYLGGWDNVLEVIHQKNLPLDFIPDFKSTTLINILFTAAGWGLGYFGQPHIVTKFMGIKNVREVSKSKRVGMTWMLLSLTAATLVGLVGIAFFKNQPLHDNEQVFITMVRQIFHPFIVGFFLCAVLAATINAMSSQVLVLSTSLTEDFYKRFFKRKAASKELLLVSRIGILLVALLAYSIALGQFSTIYGLVLYAWSGLGSSFGPLLLLSLYSKRLNRYGAWAGILVGGVVSACWPFLSQAIPTPGIQIPPLVPGFILSFVMILLVSYLTKHRESIPTKPHVA